MLTNLKSHLTSKKSLNKNTLHQNALQRGQIFIYNLPRHNILDLSWPGALLMVALAPLYPLDHRIAWALPSPIQPPSLIVNSIDHSPEVITPQTLPASTMPLTLKAITPRDHSSVAATVASSTQLALPAAAAAGLRNTQGLASRLPVTLGGSGRSTLLRPWLKLFRSQVTAWVLGTTAIGAGLYRLWNSHYRTSGLSSTRQNSNADAYELADLPRAIMPSGPSEPSEPSGTPKTPRPQGGTESFGDHHKDHRTNLEPQTHRRASAAINSLKSEKSLKEELEDLRQAYQSLTSQQIIDRIKMFAPAGTDHTDTFKDFDATNALSAIKDYFSINSSLHNRWDSQAQRAMSMEYIYLSYIIQLNKQTYLDLAQKLGLDKSKLATEYALTTLKNFLKYYLYQLTYESNLKQLRAHHQKSLTNLKSQLLALSPQQIQSLFKSAVPDEVNPYLSAQNILRYLESMDERSQKYSKYRSQGRQYPHLTHLKTHFYLAHELKLDPSAPSFDELAQIYYEPQARFTHIRRLKKSLSQLRLGDLLSLPEHLYELAKLHHKLWDRIFQGDLRPFILQKYRIPSSSEDSFLELLKIIKDKYASSKTDLAATEDQHVIPPLKEVLLLRELLDWDALSLVTLSGFYEIPAKKLTYYRRVLVHHLNSTILRWPDSQKKGTPNITTPTLQHQTEEINDVKQYYRELRQEFLVLNTSDFKNRVAPWIPSQTLEFITPENFLNYLEDHHTELHVYTFLMMDLMVGDKNKYTGKQIAQAYGKKHWNRRHMIPIYTKISKLSAYELYSFDHQIDYYRWINQQEWQKITDGEYLTYFIEEFAIAPHLIDDFHKEIMRLRKFNLISTDDHSDNGVYDFILVRELLKLHHHKITQIAQSYVMPNAKVHKRHHTIKKQLGRMIHHLGGHSDRLALPHVNQLHGATPGQIAEILEKPDVQELRTHLRAAWKRKSSDELTSVLFQHNIAPEHSDAFISDVSDLLKPTPRSNSHLRNYLKELILLRELLGWDRPHKSDLLTLIPTNSKAISRLKYIIRQDLHKIIQPLQNPTPSSLTPSDSREAPPAISHHSDATTELSFESASARDYENMLILLSNQKGPNQKGPNQKANTQERIIDDVSKHIKPVRPSQTLEELTEIMTEEWKLISTEELSRRWYLKNPNTMERITKALFEAFDTENPETHRWVLSHLLKKTFHRQLWSLTPPSQVSYDIDTAVMRWLRSNLSAEPRDMPHRFPLTSYQNAAYIATLEEESEYLSILNPNMNFWGQTLTAKLDQLSHKHGLSNTEELILATMLGLPHIHPDDLANTLKISISRLNATFNKLSTLWHQEEGQLITSVHPRDLEELRNYISQLSGQQISRLVTQWQIDRQLSEAEFREAINSFLDQELVDQPKDQYIFLSLVLGMQLPSWNLMLTITNTPRHSSHQLNWKDDKITQIAQKHRELKADFSDKLADIMAIKASSGTDFNPYTDE